MRLGVLDVGSNTVHLLVVDAHPGARPLPAHSEKTELRLAELRTDDGLLSPDGADRLVSAVGGAASRAAEKGVAELLAFATSALRDVANGPAVLRKVREHTGVTLRTLSGEEEARLTFLAARRWFGWSAGRLLLLDIGGGSLEVAYGVDEQPDVALSLPLGAGRLAREWLGGGQCSAPGAEVTALAEHVRTELAHHVRAVRVHGTPDRVVATSKTFRVLARLGADRRGDRNGRHRLEAADVAVLAAELPAMSAGERAELPGISSGRAPQLGAGAIVAASALDVFGLSEIDICPWALREGIILHRLDATRARWREEANSENT